MSTTALFFVTYTLHNRVRASLHVLAESSAAAIVQTLDHFAGQVLACSARPAHRKAKP